MPIIANKTLRLPSTIHHFSKNTAKSPIPLIVNWPMVVNTPHGSLAGLVKDVSLGGVCIFCPEKPVDDDNFSILLNPSEKRSIEVIGEKVWSDTSETGYGTVFGMGIRFIYISPGDHQYIAALLRNRQLDLLFGA